MHLKAYFFFAASAICTSAVLFWLYIWWKVIDARISWKDAKALISKIEVEEYTDTDQIVSYYPNIEYLYTIEGEEYLGKKFMYNDSSGYPLEYLKENGILDLKPGDYLTIKYDPKLPRKSVVIAKVPPGAFIALFGGLLGAFLFYVGALAE